MTQLEEARRRRKGRKGRKFWRNVTLPIGSFAAQYLTLP
jgi:hypothetical protein